MGIFSLFKGFLKPGKLIRIVAIVAVLAILGVLAFRFLGPKPLYATSTVLSILSGEQVEVNIEDKGWSKGRDNMVLRAGDRVRTGPDSYALITFFEGSTTQIEPNSEVLIKELSSVGGTTTVSLKQELGKLWIQVEQLADPASLYQVETPSGVAVVRGTLVELEVTQLGKTIARAFKGIIKVIAQQVEVLVTEGRQSSIEPNQPPAPPTLLPPPVSQLNISLSASSPAWLQVVDPLNRSAGIVPPGIRANQIPKAISSGALDKPQLIEILEPVGGQYTIMLYAQREGTLNVTVKGLTRGLVVFDPEKEAAALPGKNYRLLLQLEVVNKAITQGQLGDIGIWEGELPGKVVKQQTAVEKLALPVADFTADITQAAGGETIQFSDLTTSSPTEWSWSFGDGTTSSEQNPSHAYTSIGNYTVALIAANALGRDTETKLNYVTVYGALDVNFAADVKQGSAPLSVNFTDLSTGRPLSWEWDFDYDGAVDSAERNPVHTYSTLGTYTVSLTVTYQDGLYTDIKRNYISVQ